MKIIDAKIFVLLISVISFGPCTTASAQSVRYVHADGLGSVSVLTDQNRNIIERREYEPYGASLGISVDGVGYTGHVMDAATGLTYMQQRYYDPVVGRFLSSDPVTAYSNPVDAFNRYWYANNNPYKFIDLDGNEGKVAWLVKLTASGTRKLARLTQEQAIRARRAEQNIIADRRQVASQIETASRGGRDGQLKHAAHELEDGSKGLPHYQTEGRRGHTFWGKVSVGAFALAGTLDRVAEAAEYIPDATPRPAEESDIGRWNNAMGTISEKTGVPMPGVKMGADGGFQGYFRMEGRVDSKPPSVNFDERK
ncbi:RHS repeat-associated protein [Xanthomonas arboricola]|uniref:RHS repeat-associated core domain-containing protein n=1 Tax=Xanthomonas euroxanthea TaxID=2259622 RepID=UPI001815C9FC|nr:RHS repeat-associated core domain-containing protein [Xanthomonas euroxanthea]MBB3815124.1 RHS repeat-associated protein [Xanthomonas euroxanthea]